MGRRRLPLVVALALTGCSSGGGLPDLNPALGGDTTLDAAIKSPNVFSFPAADVTRLERRNFEIGDSFFTKNWVTAPASTDARDGLGPTMNAQACSTCHTLDGRGAPPTGPADATTRGLLLRLSVPGNSPDGGPKPEPTYGGQLQDRAVLGVPAEGRLEVTWHPVTGKYRDGAPYELRRPEFRILDLAYGPLAPGTLVSPRLAPQVIGGGLLESIPDDDLVAAADPDDANDDGVSGRVNRVADPRTGKPKLGRFGWKANVPTLEGQITGAFSGDIGITSSVNPDENCGPTATACAAAPNGGSPELEDDTLGHIVFYNRVLAVPAMRNHKTKAVRSGAKHFEKLGCATCHRVTQRTKTTPVKVLNDQTFHPYTDLLLHDMGAGLADGRPDFLATGTEWRTPPLWGIGLIESVNGARFLLHDGRARTIEEAILWHGGEAAAAQRRFRALSARERAELVAFLEAL